MPEDPWQEYKKKSDQVEIPVSPSRRRHWTSEAIRIGRFSGRTNQEIADEILRLLFGQKGNSDG